MQRKNEGPVDNFNLNVLDSHSLAIKVVATTFDLLFGKLPKSEFYRQFLHFVEKVMLCAQFGMSVDP